MGPFVSSLILLAALGSIKQARYIEDAPCEGIKLLGFLRLILMAYEICSPVLSWATGVPGIEAPYK